MQGHDLTEGNIMEKLLKFAFPIMIGNILQQRFLLHAVRGKRQG